MSVKFDVSDMLARFERVTSRSAAMPLQKIESGITKESEAMLQTSIQTPERTTRVERIKVDLSNADLKLIATMPKKVQLKMRKLMQLNIDKKAREGIVTGENPFPLRGSGYLHVAYDMLTNGGFTRATLRMTYQQRLGWTEGTAFPHVTAITWLFRAMKIAVEKDGLFIPNSILKGETKA